MSGLKTDASGQSTSARAVSPDSAHKADRDRAAARAREFSYTLVQWPSETGTSDEADFAERLAALIREWPYFQAHPDQVVMIESHGSPKVSSVVALVRGSGRRCIALSGHYDTVTIANFGALAPLARNPDSLAAALMDELSARSRSLAEERALDDLKSGAFVPGRGMLDMKSGLAAGMACLERFARQDDRIGNILFLAVPDEENRSRGMRSLRDALPKLAREWNLEIVAGINLDATSDLADGTEGRSIYLGTAGKLLPFAFVIGQATHAGYPLEGVSAHLIGAEIMRAIEVNPDLCDEAYGEIAPPPVCLEAKDLRQGYDVTMPECTWLAFNWLTYRRTPQEVLDLVEDIVRTAMDAALVRLNEHARRFHESAGGRAPPRRQGVVLTLDALRQKAFQLGGTSALARYEALLKTLATEDNPLAANRTLVASLVAEARIQGPAVIIGLGSLHYPHTHLDPRRSEHRAFQRILEHVAAETATAYGTSIKMRGFFSGISDVSFFGHRPESDSAAFIRANTPSEAFVDDAVEDALLFPAVNIGPWGREYHQKLERVHASYAFEVLPDLLYRASGAMLRAGP